MAVSEISLSDDELSDLVALTEHWPQLAGDWQEIDLSWHWGGGGILLSFP